MSSRTQAWVGTSGWHYRHWEGNFYPAGLPKDQWLAYYSAHFHSVELNNSFYRLPLERTFLEWYTSTPPGFLFSVKAPRLITHFKKLKGTSEAQAEFFHRLQALADKTGPVLFQLPPRWRVNPDRLQVFLDDLPTAYRYAFEFRDPSWHTRQVYDLLSARGAAFCIYDLGGFQSPPVVTTNYVYLRLHGPGNAYQGSYSEATLQHWAGLVQSWISEGRDVYIFFDNDDSAYAAFNAGRLKSLLAD